MKITYYTALSLDGYIAREDGSVDWLDHLGGEGEDYGYHDFFATVDGLLMGRNTLDISRTLGDWYYGDKPCWIFSHRDVPRIASGVRQFTGTPQEAVSQAQEMGLEHLWLVGGGNLAGQFLSAGLIDECILSTVPVSLGTGVPLFEGATARFRLLSIRHWPDLVQSVYAVERAE